MTTDRFQLEAAYRATTFRVETSGGRIDVRIGRDHANLDALLLRLGVTQWAYITAWNPGSRVRAAGENATAQADLMQLVRNRGFAFHEGDGIPDAEGWTPERSVWIAGVGREEAVALGRQFGQNAIVVGRIGGNAELVWVE